MNLLEGATMLCGIDILFNKGRIIRDIINLYNIRIKKLETKSVSEELKDMMFGC